MKGLKLGCAVVAGVTALVVGGVLWWGSRPGNVADVMVKQLAGSLDRFNISQAEKQRLRARLDQFVADVGSGAIPLENATPVVETLSRVFTPLLGLADGSARCFDGPQVDPSHRDEARLEVQRVARGVHERKISQARALRVHQTMKACRNDWPTASDDLMAIAKEARQAADEAGIPAEPFALDLAKLMSEQMDAAASGGAPPPR